MAQVSTWSKDAARGLAHPASGEAKSLRIMQARKFEEQRNNNLSFALGLIRQNAATRDDLINVLEALSTALASTSPNPGTDMEESLQLLDMLTGQIKFNFFPRS